MQNASILSSFSFRSVFNFAFYIKCAESYTHDQQQKKLYKNNHFPFKKYGEKNVRNHFPFSSPDKRNYILCIEHNVQ